MNNLKNCVLVKAIGYFNKKNDDEINLNPGDVLQVIKKIDKNWLYGIQNDREGKFPSNQVIKIDIHHELNNAINIFICSQSFTKQRAGDLSFCKNDILIALRKKDNELYEGRKLNLPEIGTFNLSYVWKIKDISNYESKFSDNLYAKVLYDMIPQLEDELNLKKDEIVQIYGEHDEMFYSGELNGEKGIFPKNFVSIIQKPSSNEIPNIYKNDTNVENNYLPPYELVTNYMNIQTDISPYGRTLYAFDGINENELSFDENQIVKLIRYVDDCWMEGELNGKVGIFPKNHIEIILDCPNSYIYNQENNYDTFENDEHFLDHNVEIEEFSPGTTGVVLFDFEAQMDGDLSLKKGEKINLLRKFNNDWVEVFNGLEIGICPLNYIEVLSNQIESISNVNNILRSDNLIEFSPEKKASEINKKQEINYDALIELDVERHKNNTLELVDFSFKSNNDSEKKFSLPEKSFQPEISLRPKTPFNLKNTEEKHIYEPCYSKKSFESKLISKNDKLTDEKSNDQLPINKRPLDKQLIERLRQQRECIITELFQSEKDYQYALSVCYDTFFKNEKIIESLKEKRVNINILFSNLKEIIDISHKLVSSLSNESNKSFDSQLIGKSFLDIGTLLENSYLTYCNNYNNMQSCFEKYEKDLEINKIFQKCFEEICSKTNCFDIPSILIKPVQRILRYPLLLNELIKCTDSELEDYEYLQKSLKMITDMAKNINEYKRRKDLVFKYRRENLRQNSFSNKLSKINLHTLKKKYSRFNYKLTSTIGLNNKNKDNEFNFELSKFRFLEKSIRIFLKNLSQFIDNLENYVKITFNLNQNICTFYGEKNNQPLVIKSKLSHENILNNEFKRMKNKVQTHVSDILNQFLNKFQNPEKLINKRHDKLIDFKTATKNYELIKDSSKTKHYKEQLDISKDIYEALNHQLINDLPYFTSHGFEIYNNCILAFITIYKKFIGKVVEQMLHLITLPPIEQSSFKSSNDIIETFQIKHNLIAQKLINDFLLIPNNIFPQILNNSTLATAVLDKQKLLRNSKILNNITTQKSKRHFQTAENRISLLSDPKIKKNNLYIVTNDYDPIDVLDLKALKDDIVVVIKKKDPTGLESRWYVDNGNDKGFLPKKILTPKNIETLENSLYSCSNVNRIQDIQAYESNLSNSDYHSQQNIYANINNYQNLLNIDDFDPLKQSQLFNVEEAYKINNDPKINDINLKRDEPPCNEYYRATHPFKEIGPKQLSLELNEIVVVKYKCDLYKSSEWWYVENEQGKCGYVPGNRLSEK